MYTAIPVHDLISRDGLVSSWDGVIDHADRTTVAQDAPRVASHQSNSNVATTGAWSDSGNFLSSAKAADSSCSTSSGVALKSPPRQRCEHPGRRPEFGR